LSPRCSSVSVHVPDPADIYTLSLHDALPILLKNKFKKAGLDIEVTNSAINQLKGDEDIIITQKTLTERAENKVPTAKHISVDNFLNSPAYDELLEDLQDEQGTVQTEEAVESEPADFDYSKVDKVVFSCDAGMGSSAMG